MKLILLGAPGAGKGVMDMANRVTFSNAPPDIIFKKPSKLFPAVVAESPPIMGAMSSANASRLRKGTGIAAPIRNTMMIIRVKRIFFLRSTIFHAFLMV